MNLSSTKASLKFDAHAEVRERPFDFHGGGGGENSGPAFAI